MLCSIPAFHDEAVSDAYEDLNKMVHNIAHKLAACYRMQAEDLSSEAHIVFMKACQTYDRSKGAKVSSWVHAKVTWGLLSYIRKESKHGCWEPLEAAEHIGTQVSQFPLEFKGEVGMSANRITALILDSPRDFLVLLRYNCAATPRTIKQAICEYMEDEGWEPGRAQRAISEVEEVLQEWNNPKSIERKKAKESEWLYNKIGLTPNEVRRLLSP